MRGGRTAKGGLGLPGTQRVPPHRVAEVEPQRPLPTPKQRQNTNNSRRTKLSVVIRKHGLRLTEIQMEGTYTYLISRVLYNSVAVVRSTHNCFFLHTFFLAYIFCCIQKN